MCLNANIILGLLLIQQGYSTALKHVSDHDPQQIHIAYGDEPCESMTITWSTNNETPPPTVIFGPEGLTEKVEGITTRFVDTGKEARVQYVHRVKLTGLKPATNNFTQYRMRFSMPGNTESLFYSFNLGPAHFISIDTEAYYYPEFGVWPLVNQWNWLINDLKEANKRENRQKRPWIIVYGHHPMYCSNLWIDDCSLKTTKTRVGIPNKKNNWYEYGLEEIFYNAGVDIEFWGHEHSYERLYPMYDYTVKKGSKKDPYNNPQAPVHITSGIAGSRYRSAYFSFIRPSWSAFRSTEYGYTQIHVHNTTHINIKQITVKKKVIDDVWLVKNHDKVFGLNEDEE